MQTAVSLSTISQVHDEVEETIRQLDRIFKKSPHVEDLWIMDDALMDIFFLKGKSVDFFSMQTLIMNQAKRKILPDTTDYSPLEPFFIIAKNLKFCQGSRGERILDMLKERRNKCLLKKKNLYSFLVVEKKFKSEYYPLGQLRPLDSMFPDFNPNYQDRIAMELRPGLTLDDIEYSLKEFYEKKNWIFKKDFHDVIKVYDPASIEDPKTSLRITVMKPSKKDDDNSVLALSIDRMLV